jgi:hypothetical protein
LTNSDTEDEAKDIQEAARGLGLQILVVRAAGESDLDSAFATLAQQGARALIVGADTFLLASVAKSPCAPPAIRFPTCGWPGSRSMLAG